MSIEPITPDYAKSSVKGKEADPFRIPRIMLHLSVYRILVLALLAFAFFCTVRLVR